MKQMPMLKCFDKCFSLIGHSKKHEEVHVQKILFLGEQDGHPERLLKSKLADFFARDQSVKKAYLTRACLDGKNISVVLGLRTKFGADKGLVEKIGSFFAIVFNGKEHLDIIFLDDDQETTLGKVCKPFFEKDEDNTVKTFSFGSLLIESPANASEEKVRENVEELLTSIYGQIPAWLKFKVGRRFERLGTTYREFLCPAGSVDTKIQLQAQQKPGIACSIILRGVRSGKPCCIEVSDGIETEFDCEELRPF